MNRPLRKDPVEFPFWLLKDPNYIYTKNGQHYLIISDSIDGSKNGVQSTSTSVGNNTR
jgi:hypothetical protein